MNDRHKPHNKRLSRKMIKIKYLNDQKIKIKKKLFFNNINYSTY